MCRTFFGFANEVEDQRAEVGRQGRRWSHLIRILVVVRSHMVWMTQVTNLEDIRDSYISFSSSAVGTKCGGWLRCGCRRVRQLAGAIAKVS